MIFDTIMQFSGNLRQAIADKKREWAETKDYYTPSRKWGEHEEYGFELKSPYSEYEVAPIKDVIPVDLYWYLINISRETHVSAYPTVFEIKPVPPEIREKSASLDKDVTYIRSDEVDIDRLMMKVANSGCAFFDAIYIGRDDQFGSVWSYMDDDAWVKTSSTFLEYVLHTNRLSS